MPARQYIGARYVTKIYENSLDPASAEWESGINYEPLILVTYNMGSYLSKKEVPASVGDPASNPQYWVQTGFYNGQIAALDAKKLDRYTEGPSDWDSTPTDSSTKAMTSGAIYNALAAQETSIDAKIEKREILVLSTGSTVVTSLPYTFTNTDIESDMVCIHDELGTPASQLNDWSVSTGNGTCSISGNIDAAGTTIKIFLMKSR